MSDDEPLLDEDRIDIDELLDLGQRGELHAHDEWIESVKDRIGYEDYTGGRGSFDPDEYDDNVDWLMAELSALLIRAHEHDVGLLDFSGSLKAVDEQIINIADIGVGNYAKKVGREDEFARGPSPGVGRPGDKDGTTDDEADGSEFTNIEFDTEE